ncbi:hypothetical protein [uncultured Aquitalea sp.]|uniref:hypothetical protein n=1 Tax=uncultured Aquitalea sp. TaxID=540272 RepID=UPI0025EFA48D|nr:hypothetical protein [uncultured Aquitalea sp.]
MIAQAQHSALSVQRRSRHLLARFASRALDELKRQGVPLSPAICLSRQGERLRTVTPHPQAERILDGLNRHRELIGLFHEVQLHVELLQRLRHPSLPFLGGTRFRIGLTSAGPMAFFENNHPSGATRVERVPV